MLYHNLLYYFGGSGGILNYTTKVQKREQITKEIYLFFLCRVQIPCLIRDQGTKILWNMQRKNKVFLGVSAVTTPQGVSRFATSLFQRPSVIIAFQSLHLLNGNMTIGEQQGTTNKGVTICYSLKEKDRLIC